MQFEGQFDLCLDRTNWKFGQKDINYLVLSWRVSKEMALPLMFVELDKAGNSNTAQRVDLLGQFHEVFGFGRIKSLMADREFVGNNWFEMLNQNNIPYFIRVKEGTLLPWGPGEALPARRFFQHLGRHHSRLIEKTMYGGTVYFAGTYSNHAELVVVVTNRKLKASQILKKYRQRWSIEEHFRKLKTSGFHWENTHMKQSARLVTLLIILSFALMIASLNGMTCKIPWKKTLGCHLYSTLKQGLINLNFMVAKSITNTVKTIIKLIQNAQIIIS